MTRYATRAETAQPGDAVEHNSSHETGVVIDRLGRTRLVVQTTPGVTVVWYAASVTII